MKVSPKLKLAQFQFGFLFISDSIQAQEKRLKRPSGRVGITSVNTFVRESFDLYDRLKGTDCRLRAEVK